jgi:hypothetical protein
MPNAVLTFRDAERGISNAIRRISMSERWAVVPRVAYSSEPSSTSTLSMATGSLSVGMPIKYAQNGSIFYAIITAVSDGSITISGAPFSAGETIDVLWIGKPELVRVEHFVATGAYGTTVSQPIVGVGNGDLRKWLYAPGYVVDFKLSHKTNAGTTNPKVGFAAYTSSAWRQISTADSGNGYTVTTSWQSNGVAIDTANYRVLYDDRIDFYVNVARVGTDPAGFVGHAVFVLE